MEDIFTLIIIMFVLFLIYKYTLYQKMKKIQPCKIIYKMEE